MKTVEQKRQLLESYICSLDYSHEPESLYAPINYSLSLGGKRLRPLLLMMAYCMYGDRVEEILDVASGIEIFHNFTLLHDDVMDKAEIRRGKPSVRKKWNDNVAILSGDAMFALSYKYIVKCPVDKLPKLLDIVNNTFIGITEGQQYDMEFEMRDNVREDEYMEMIRLKTSILIAASLKIGALLGDATEDDMHNLYLFGEKIGAIFQLQDDLLDVFGDPNLFGKKIGGDILCEKKTYLYIKARLLANEQQQAELNRWSVYNGPDNHAKIAAVTSIFRTLKIKELCEQKIDTLFIEAIRYLDMVSVKESLKTELKEFVCSLINRQI